ncbi:MAG TPA: polysaccharide lyase family 8 super-sandwich domain-containing protein [Thermoanaerobaculia bacterium]
MRKLLVSLILLVASTAAHAADIDVVRQNFIEYYAATNADATAPRMRSALGELEHATRTYTAAGYLLSDGSWSDIDYVKAPDGNWGPWDHSRRLIVMAKAYKTPGQAFYRDPRLLAQIDAALAYTKRFYGPTIIPTGNWWFWTIGIPIDLGPTLVLMRGEINQQTYDDLVLAINLRILNSPTGRGLVGPTPTGQNLVWSAFTHLCLALLKDDSAMLTAVRDAMTIVAKPGAGTAEGVKPDSSFHQHGAQLYTGGYGGQFANDVARYALLARGTSYALPASSMVSFVNYLADGVAWSLYGNYFDVSVVGREVARSSTSGYNGLAALLQGSTFDSIRAKEIRAAAAKMLETWQGTMPTELAAITTQIERARYPAAWPTGHRHYYASDYTIHRRNGWFASIKMFSKRTKSGENTNDENVRGSRQSDGRMYLSLTGNELFGRNVIPSLDWTRLPGITVEQRPNAADATYGYGTRALAGGTTNGQNGVSAMELAPLGAQLTAKKAWFFFDDSIAFLTSSITSPSSYRVETVVNQWPLLNASSQVAQSGDWAQLENIGYWFPSGTASLKTYRDTRSGTWAALGGSSDNTEHAKPIVTMLFDHGATPTNASAEYVIVPNISASAMKSWAAARPLSIVANTNVASAVRDNRTGAFGIAFWTSGSIEGIQSDAAALLFLEGDTRNAVLSAADPTSGASGSFKVTLPGTWYTTDVVSTVGPRSTTLTIPRAGGQTTKVKLQRIFKRRAA